jgi:ribosome biogenesis GTPase
MVPVPGRLEALGWSPAWRDRFAPYALVGLEPGRVALEHNHVYRVFAADGERLAEAAGSLKHRAGARADLPAVGDWVALPPDRPGERTLIRALLPRQSAYSRKAAGRETEEQVVAANVDVVFVVYGLGTHVRPRGVERYLVLARRSGATPVVVLNKADLSPDLPADLDEAVRVAGGVPVHAVSAKRDPDLASLDAYLAPGRTVALLGPSGVGKSSIVNRLVGRELLPTGEVREWDARGRHTSVHRELVVRAGGGVIIDTPGMRELQLWDADEAVDETFADVAALAAACRFRDCRHDREPGCAVKAAVEAGDLDAGRLDGYLGLQRERESLERLKDERARSDAKRQAKVQQRALRSHLKTKRDR